MSDKTIVVPGDLVSEKPMNLDGTYVENGKTYASTIAVMGNDVFSPLEGQYLPKRGDYVIGIIKEERFSGYSTDINSPYEGDISARDTREEFKVGEVLSAKIISVNEVNEATLVEPRRLSGGEIIEIEAVKVPRLIGRNGSMLEILKQKTGTDIFIGKNGRIYLKGGNTALASLAILKISKEAHTSGLTDRIIEYLDKEVNNNGRG